MAITYAFLTPDDVLTRIRDEHRNDLVDRTDPNSEPPSEAIELSAESMALAKMRSALSGRYDVATLFAATGADRSPLLVLHLLNIFVYLLYRRINPRKIPEEVKLDHEETLEWLAKVADGKENPDFPAVVPDEDNTNLPRYGGGQCFRGSYF